MAWKHGQKAELARRAGDMNYTHLCDIIAKRKDCPKDRAVELQAAALSMGIKTSLFDWLYNMSTTNSLFGPAADKEEQA